MNVTLLTSFLDEFSWFTLATRAIDHQPYATPLYGAAIAVSSSLQPPCPAFVFYSSPGSNHGEHLGTGPTQVAGATGLASQSIRDIRGAQFRGTVWRSEQLRQQIASMAETAYLQRFPQAQGIVRSGSSHALYLLTIHWLKLTDNRLGLGTHPVYEFAAADADTMELASGDPFPNSAPAPRPES